MADDQMNRPRIVKMRLMGRPVDVDTVVAHVAESFAAGVASPPHPNRRDPETVRVYLEVEPE